eukprot:scaffold171435_cov32-Tisochrysis_lutea.AAC.1
MLLPLPRDAFTSLESWRGLALLLSSPIALSIIPTPTSCGASMARTRPAAAPTENQSERCKVPERTTASTPVPEPV